MPSSTTPVRRDPRLTTALERDVLHSLRIRALLERRPVRAVVAEAITQYLDRHDQALPTHGS